MPKKETSYKASIRIPYNILDEIDKLAEYHDRDRSGEINHALTQYIDNYHEEGKIKDMLDELEADPRYEVMHIKYKALKEKFTKELDKAFLEIMEGD